MDKYRDNGFWIKLIILAALTVLAFFGSFLIGSYPIDTKTVWDIIRSGFMRVDRYWDDTLATVVMNVRLPRIIAALLIGGALSVSGASYQTLFKNPMVSPDLLGVSAGAGFGAAIAMLNGALGGRYRATRLFSVYPPSSRHT